jgi:cysteinyl-tRNA synthetase
LPAAEKLALALDFDQVLGLRFEEVAAASAPELAAEVQLLIDERDAARKAKEWARSDALRDHLHSLGFEVQDTPQGTKVKARVA